MNPTALSQGGSRGGVSRRRVEELPVATALCLPAQTPLSGVRKRSPVAMLPVSKPVLGIQTGEHFSQSELSSDAPVSWQVSVVASIIYSRDPELELGFQSRRPPGRRRILGPGLPPGQDPGYLGGLAHPPPPSHPSSPGFQFTPPSPPPFKAPRWHFNFRGVHHWGAFLNL